MQFARLFVANFLHKAHVLGFVKSVSVLCTVLYMSMFVHATCFISIIRGLRSQAYKRLLMGSSGSFLTDFPPGVSDDWLFAIFTLPGSDMRHMVRHRLILSSERVAGMGGRPPIESYVAKTSPACRTSALIDTKKENRR